MKIFQILDNICHYDMTPVHPTLEDTVGKYAPDIIIVEAPDYVFEGWGFDDTEEGDARFVKPVPPEGWLYDDATGTFYPENHPEALQRINSSEAFAIIMGEDVTE